MERPYILHLFTPTRQASPFDVNMALDAGYNAVVPYTDVMLDQVASLTQDAIFSRGPKGVKRTGIFIGGRDIGLAADMLDAARNAMVPPFEVSVFADPSGAFTTAAAMVAAVERQLKKVHQTDFAGRQVLILGGTGPVGTAAAVLAAGAGARVKVASHTSLERARMTAQVANARYGVSTEAVGATSAAERADLIAETEILLATAKAGVQVASKKDLARATRLLVAADVNAVPPAGIEGVGVMDDGAPLEAASGKAVGIGALAIGNIKYQVQRGLFEEMLKGDKALYLDFRDAFAAARRYAA
ncbi:NAD(P)-dependent methylenetetrahydromethanopterin dehydrogenase [Pelomicrobium sp. G1]|uniref:NAD(P)-dependent methylenetetrahydromethanopterin dehydrogenase n=1 Tax=unclassified Pelomicrobium TaxID=2815318 RepID=UPI000A5059DE|nr:MAG: methylenetetrahydromethanopterin dehydrogenase [Burkholderiales bacterium]